MFSSYTKFKGKGYSRNRRATGLRRTTLKINYAADDILMASPNLKRKKKQDDDDSDDDEDIEVIDPKWNPGPRLTLMDTNHLRDVADDIFIDIQDTVVKRKQTLISLEGWMEKKQTSLPYSWLKRWVTVHDGWLLWSDRQIKVGKDGVNKKEKKRWIICRWIIFC